jgi:hypothetical protein
MGIALGKEEKGILRQRSERKRNFVQTLNTVAGIVETYMFSY